MPVHLAGCHWGLMVIDVASQEFYFDDGMRFNPPPIDLAVAVMKSLEQNSLTEDRPQTISWPQRHVYRRFRMPQQPSDGSLQGSGSCGVGCKRLHSAGDKVLLAAHMVGLQTIQVAPQETSPSSFEVVLTELRCMG